MRIDESVLNKFSTFAKLENRSLSNFMETATMKYINELEFTDDFETKSIFETELLIIQHGLKFLQIKINKN